MPLRAPADKIPLTARKDVKDNWEHQKSKYEQQISEVMGCRWNIDVNPNLIYVYAGNDYASRVGTTITWYMDPFVRNLKEFARKYGQDGLGELNGLASKHILYFGPQDTTNFSNGGLAIIDGILHMVFHEDRFCNNVNYVSQNFQEAINNAPPPAGASVFNLNARNSVAHDFEPKIVQVRDDISKLVGIAGLKLDGNFEENSKVLAKHGEKDWDTRIGFTTWDYFRGFAHILNYKKFGSDDLLQEAFQEAVEKNIIRVRCFPTWPDNSSQKNRCVVEDGILYLETTTKDWGVNVNDAGKKITDIL